MINHSHISVDLPATFNEDDFFIDENGKPVEIFPSSHTSKTKQVRTTKQKEANAKVRKQWSYMDDRARARQQIRCKARYRP